MERNLDFDTVIDRKHTRSLKFDHAVSRGLPEDVLSLWVADMDFKTSSYIEDALQERVKHAIFGYSEPVPGDSYYEAVHDWLLSRHGLEIKEEWIVKTPGVVYALAAAVRAYTKPGDAVMIEQPVYYPFAGVIKENGRRIVNSDLYQDETGRYRMNFEDIEQKLQAENVKLFLLCSPHNPVGRVWEKEELTQLGELCLKYHVLVVSDEIHCDYVFRGKHIPFASIDRRFEENSITCTAPSKTFNLATMMLANILIPREDLRKRFIHEMDACGLDQMSVFGLTACEAAYRHGGEWYEAVSKYIGANIGFAKEFVERELPGVSMTETEGTYLIWLDFRALGLSVKELDDRIINWAKLWLDSGKIFGKAGEGFQRINTACSRTTLTECLERLKRVL